MIGSKFFWLVSVSQLGILAQVFLKNNFWLLKIENYLSDSNIFSNYFKYHSFLELVLKIALTMNIV